MTRKLTCGISAFALIATSASPAFAEVTEDNTPTQEDLDAMCMAEPSITSGFEATAVLGERQQIGEPQIEYGPAQTGPNYDDPQGQRGELLSPNEFKFLGDYDLGYVIIGVNVFNLHTTKIVRTEAKQTQYKMNFDCHVHKNVNGKGNDPIHKRGWIAPPDEQIFGLESAGYWINENRDVVTFSSDIVEEFAGPARATQCKVDDGEWSIFEYFDLGLDCDVLEDQYEAGEISMVNGYDVDGGDAGDGGDGGDGGNGGDGGDGGGPVIRLPRFNFE
ncbi:MAG: hypothetical protein DI637_02135 [Citromicrobium sp.]|nr:MAG: hypothetical protein DI637_02135 [Citromicrobium sp.]